MNAAINLLYRLGLLYRLTATNRDVPAPVAEVVTSYHLTSWGYHREMRGYSPSWDIEVHMAGSYGDILISLRVTC